MRCDEMNKELIEKTSVISCLQDQIKSLENYLKNYKKSLQSLSEKSSNQDSFLIEINTKNKKIDDLEDQIKNLHVEIMYILFFREKKYCVVFFLLLKFIIEFNIII